MTSRRVYSFVKFLEGSQSSFRARKSSEMRGRTTRLEPQQEDNEDSDFNSYAADHQDYEDQNVEDEEDGDGVPFTRYRRRSGEFHFQTHTPRYYGRSHTPPRGVLPTHPPRLQGQIRTQPQLQLQAQAQTSHSVSYSSTQNQSLSIHSLTTTTTATTTTAVPLVPTSISAAPSVSLPVSNRVAHMEDMTESELDLDLDDDLERDRDVGASTVRQVSGAAADALLPSLGYLDEALSFIAEERAKWSAAMEGGAVGVGGNGSGSGSGSGAGAGGSAGVDSRFAKGGGGKKSESRKVFGTFPFSFLQIFFLGLALWC